MTGKNNQSLEPPKYPPLRTHTKSWHRMVANFCIFFLVISIVMLYFSYTGKPQAGLLEMGVSAFLFCVLFHLVMKFFPLISKIITSLLIIGFAVSLVCINYHFLKVEKKDASLEELLVGDLFVNKIMKTFRKEPVSLALKGGVPEQVSVQKDSVPLAMPSLDQLKMTLSNPISSKFTSKYSVALSPAMKEGTLFLKESYKGDIDSKYIQPGIFGILAATTESGPPIYEPIDNGDFVSFSLSACNKEKLLTASDMRIIQLPISIGVGATHEIKLCNPIRENRVPID